MGTGLLSSAVSGMQSAQIGLQTAQHNISNQNTLGFNRQRIVQASNTAMLTGAGFIGQGAHVSTVERMYDQFLNTQVNRAQTTTSELETYYTQISQIDNMLADANSGVSSALQDFFKGVQQVAANPAQLSARQSMVSSAEALVARFQGMGNRLEQMYQDINGQISTQVASVNSYATQIAELNQRITIAQSSINQPPNDLMDQILWSQPAAGLLIGSPAVQHVRWSQQSFPATLPGGVRDSAPLMRPHTIPVSDDILSMEAEVAGRWTQGIHDDIDPSNLSTH